MLHDINIYYYYYYIFFLTAVLFGRPVCRPDRTDRAVTKTMMMSNSDHVPAMTASSRGYFGNDESSYSQLGDDFIVYDHDDNENENDDYYSSQEDIYQEICE